MAPRSFRLQWLLVLRNKYEILYVGSPPVLFVLMSIVQSPSSKRLSLRTEHFFEPRPRPLV
ncbi:hypothetical protein EYF80_035442 [Liparis tanakae]|uniref:Uncharacterized protein n=1 Tax=Liparis tanakae TaxID=230148 RepID=A0A4Z2GNX8_9TELE|nr:hypothetical protein EYF80_035442 [Liparis tanakae]